MAFDIQRLGKIHIGGTGAFTKWFYSDPGDNVASLAGAGVATSTAYFQRAFDDHGIRAREGDLFEISNSNAATPVCFGRVQADWDANGASVTINTTNPTAGMSSP